MLAGGDEGNDRATVPFLRDRRTPVEELRRAVIAKERSGRFPLISYGRLKRADFLAEVTANRRMPPWKPEPGYGDFHDERRLSDRRFRCSRNGPGWRRPRGRKICRPRPAFLEGWQLGKPDMVLKAADPSPCRLMRESVAAS